MNVFVKAEHHVSSRDKVLAIMLKGKRDAVYFEIAFLSVALCVCVCVCVLD